MKCSFSLCIFFYYIYFYSYISYAVNIFCLSVSLLLLHLLLFLSFFFIMLFSSSSSSFSISYFFFFFIITFFFSSFFSSPTSSYFFHAIWCTTEAYLDLQNPSPHVNDSHQAVSSLWKPLTKYARSCHHTVCWKFGTVVITNRALIKQ